MQSSPSAAPFQPMAKRSKILFDSHPTLPFEEFETPASATVGNPKAYATSSSADEELALTDDDRKRDANRNLLQFISLGSGSSGNSCYIGTEKGGILIDAGVREDTISDLLAGNGLSIKNVKALLLTHDHSDHVKSAYTILRNNKHIRLYCTNRVLQGILRRHSISKRIKEYHNPIFKEIPFKILDFEITAFEVPHDGSDNMGFSISMPDGRNFVLATDLGAVQERARHYMQLADYLVIEANYDLDMLLHGKYPEYLKARIQTEHGHMDNAATAAFLKEIITPRLQYIFLCHLSKDNNTPSKALKAVRDALEGKGLRVGNAEYMPDDRNADVQLMALPRFEASPLFIFRH